MFYLVLIEASLMMTISPFFAREVGHIFRFGPRKKYILLNILLDIWAPIQTMHRRAALPISFQNFLGLLPRQNADVHTHWKLPNLKTKQNHWWWRHHCRLLECQSPYFQLKFPLDHQRLFLDYQNQCFYLKWLLCFRQ